MQGASPSINFLNGKMLGCIFEASPVLNNGGYHDHGSNHHKRSGVIHRLGNCRIGSFCYRRFKSH